MNILFTASLVTICLICYILLIILYVQPQLYHLPSLIYVESSSSIRPTVAVGLITAAFAAATSAFITRCVEHSIWLKLAPREVRNPLTAGETTRLALWSVSPLQRLIYAVNGQFWLIKMSGLLLLAVSIVSPVLLAGISQTERISVASTTSLHESDYWAPWITRGNAQYLGGSSNDLSFGMAVQASNGGFSAPVAPVCADNSCSVLTTSSALFATCNARATANTRLMGMSSCGKDTPLGEEVTNYCSDIIPSMCVNLTCGAPSTYANFIAGLDSDCESGFSSDACLLSPGSWSVIFGAWAGDKDDTGIKRTINTVSCLVEYGNVTITQVGSNTPRLDRDSFRRSSYLLHNYSSPISNVRTFVWGENVELSPYYFTVKYVGTGWDDIYRLPFASGLLGDDAANNASHVARQIEANFDWATMGALARMPNASDVVTTTRTTTRMYVYNELVLLILLVPFLASVMGTWGRWTIGSDDDVPGYDPVAIATRGPVEGVSPMAFAASHEYRRACEKLRLTGFEESAVDPCTGRSSARVRLLAQQ